MYLISYDIENDRRRKKVADKLLAFGLERIQYSVFAGPLKPVFKQSLEKWLTTFWEPAKWPADQLFILPVQRQQFIEMTILGAEKFDPEYVAGSINTLIL